ncbi:uncharacterized protein J8A68_000424 [[Candida] subhashii]|uniref:EamA domain-containing protein n=1 Tax=[Candida] subhashii TaxID=561895 RepID=A0A8J5QSK8_9ASCO|nr:uncharacterized protein J8A68_000424 [[Candida] subhashii]KAG7665994.1 hypothetical protein J8A68_000424 [[Candida] subhashii]
MPHERPSHFSPNHGSHTPMITSDPIEVVEIINDQEIENYRWGIILLVVSVTTWIIGLELVNAVLKGDSYTKPFLFAVISGSSYIVNFVPDIFNGIKRVFTGSKRKDSVALVVPSIEETTPLLESSSRDTVNNITNTKLEKTISEDFENPIELTTSEIWSLAVQIAFIYYLYNSFVMEALQFTSASNQTVLGTTSSAFTLVIGVFLKIEKFSIKKVLCVVCSFLGVFMVNFGESVGENKHRNKFESKNPQLGNLLALGGALMYALYLINMKLKCGTGNKVTNERRLFAYAGLITLLVGIPLLYILDHFGIEKFELPPNNSIMASVLINGVFSALSDYAAMLAMLLTSPLVVSLTLTSGIPITIFIDYIILFFTSGKDEHHKTSFLYFLGIICIILSVLLVNINITSENELIEEVIEEALEEAIRRDEIMSPVLSPLLAPPTTSGSHTPFLRTPGGGRESPVPFQVGIHASNILSSLTPKARPGIARHVSEFVLEGTNPCHQHHHHLQKHRSLLSFERMAEDGEEEDEDEPNIVVMSGTHHQYRVKSLNTQDSERRNHH